MKFRCSFRMQPQIVHGGIYALPTTPCIETAIIYMRTIFGVERTDAKPRFFCYGHAMTVLNNFPNPKNYGWEIESIDQFIARMVDDRLHAAQALRTGDWTLYHRAKGYELAVYNAAAVRG